jgi:hypothetical protein
VIRHVAVAALLGGLTACSQPAADDLPDGSVAVVPAVAATDLDVPDDAQFVSVTPRTPVGGIVDDAIRGARAAEIVAAIGRLAPPAYLPACTGNGDVILILPGDVTPDEARDVLYQIVRDLDFLDITQPEVLPRTAVAGLTCAAESRPLPTE